MVRSARVAILLVGQVIASSNEGTLDYNYCWEYTKKGFNSGLGIIVEFYLLLGIYTKIFLNSGFAMIILCPSGGSAWVHGLLLRNCGLGVEAPGAVGGVHTIEPRNLEYDRPVIPKQKPEGKPP